MDIEETIDDIAVLYRELLKLRADFEALKREYDIMARRLGCFEGKGTINSSEMLG